MSENVTEREGHDGLSLIVPVYRNAANIVSLVQVLEQMNKQLDGRFEVIFVVDGSPDGSGELLVCAQGKAGFRSTIIFHSRNFGSFTAIRTGLENANGLYFAAMAADLQEPPELILSFVEILQANDADIVFGRRVSRNDSLMSDAMSNSFWWLYRKMVMRDMPSGGVDIFGCNRDARSALLSISEPNSSLIAQLFWIGFRREFVSYERRKRSIGKSSWSFAKRVRYMMDSILSISDLPILAILWIGLFGLAVSASLGVVSIIGKLTGLIEVEGYTTLVLLISFFGCLTLTVNGLIGSYIWRTYENTKRRPLRIIRKVVAR